MPAYIATYDVEIAFEGSGEYINVEFDYEFHADNYVEANRLADRYCENDIFDDIMSNISIVPIVENVAEQ